jgi:hypothetical protein
VALAVELRELLGQDMFLDLIEGLGVLFHMHQLV